MAAAAAAAMLLLVPLLVSQQRDLTRLREWMEAAPDHPVGDMTANEAILDRAETELEELEATMAGPPAPAAPLRPAEGISAAARVTGDRPALERITIERAALAPHPRWRRFVRTATQSRVLAILAVGAALGGAVAIATSGRLLGRGEVGGPPAKHGPIDPGDVRVAVLNGTSVPGLGGKVATDIEVNGFQPGIVSNSERHYDQTVVMFEPGQQRAAEKVARVLGVTPVQRIDAGTRRLGGDADVVVIAGDDRTG